MFANRYISALFQQSLLMDGHIEKLNRLRQPNNNSKYKQTQDTPQIQIEYLPPISGELMMYW